MKCHHGNYPPCEDCQRVWRAANKIMAEPEEHGQQHVDLERQWHEIEGAIDALAAIPNEWDAQRRHEIADLEKLWLL
jgi:hypothetical protein